MNKNILAIIAGIIIIAGAFYITGVENNNEDIDRPNEQQNGEDISDISNDNNNEEEDENKKDEKEVSEEFIACLKDAGVVVYGSEWCPACSALVESLGGYEMAEPIYVECTVEEERCNEEMEGGSVPEIQIGGELFKVGSIPPQVLADETGCEL